MTPWNALVHTQIEACGRSIDALKADIQNVPGIVTPASAVATLGQILTGITLLWRARSALETIKPSADTWAQTAPYHDALAALYAALDGYHGMSGNGIPLPEPLPVQTVQASLPDITQDFEAYKQAHQAKQEAERLAREAKRAHERAVQEAERLAREAKRAHERAVRAEAAQQIHELMVGVFDRAIADSLDEVNAIVGKLQVQMLAEQGEIEHEYKQSYGRIAEQLKNNTDGLYDQMLAAISLSKTKRKAIRDGKVPPEMVDEFIRKRIAPRIAELQKAHEQTLEKLGQQLIKHAFKQTGITRRQAAKAFREGAELHENVLAKYEANGWHTAQQDIITAYQLIGNLGTPKRPVRFNALDKGGRAYFFDWADFNAIVLSGSIGELLHEVGHYVDVLSPAANELAETFFRKRTAKQKPQTLAKLTGLPFGEDEVAIPDDFVDPYVGKLYSDRPAYSPDAVFSSEVISMGLERLASPQTAAELALRDPEHLALIFTILKLNKKATKP